MSRSYRKHAIIGVAGTSEKRDKQRYNRRLRHATRQVLDTQPDSDTLPHLYEYSNSWSMAKDGKRYFDAKSNPNLLRK